MFKGNLSLSKTKSTANWILSSMLLTKKIFEYFLLISWIIVIASIIIHPVASSTSSSSSSSDMLFIRHGRSRVRHSNEKDHIRWGLQAFDNLTLDYDSYDNDTGLGGSSSGSGGGGQLFGSEFWLTTDNNGSSFFNQTNAYIGGASGGVSVGGIGGGGGTGNLSMSFTGLSQRQQTTESPTIITTNGVIVAPHSTSQSQSPIVVVTATATTQKRRKLHKKKIMENIRKNVDKGLEYLKSHKNLDENLSRIQEEVVVASQEYGYQNDESVNLLPSTTTTTTKTTENKKKIMTSSILSFSTYTTTSTAEPFSSKISDDERTTVVKSEKIKNLSNIWSTLSTSTLPPLSPTAKNNVKEQQLVANDNDDNDDNDDDMGTIFFGKLKVNDKNLDTFNLSRTLSYNSQNVTNTDTFDNNKNSNNRKTDKISSISSSGSGSGSGIGGGGGSSSNNLRTDNNNEKKTKTKSKSRAKAMKKVSSYLENSDNFDSDYRLKEHSQVEGNDFDYMQEKNFEKDFGPSHSASTSIGRIGIDQNIGGIGGEHFEEINFEDNLDVDGTTGTGTNTGSMNVVGVVGEDILSDDDDGVDDEDDDNDSNKFLDGVVDGANEDEIYDWDEISRNNRRNLMRGRDVVTKFLQIVETQHLLGSNCEAGTSLNLGEGVVDRYAQDRFRVEAEVAVNRANMLTRIFKMTSPSVQSSVNLLHASVLSMVEFDDDIFAAGNCFDWNQYPSQPGLFCPFAYRLPPPNHGAIIAKDLATEYHYLGNTSEWFFLARKNAEKVIAHNDQYIKSFHLYSNKTDERIEDDTLAVRYEDGRWSKPYYDCGGGNIWMLTYTVPFFGYENGTYFFKGTSGIDIDLRRVDIDQCPQRNTPGTTQPLNIFAGTDKCKQRTTMCEPLNGLGFRRGSYKCVCRKGFYYPDTTSTHKFFNGSLLEEEYEKLMLGRNSTYNIILTYECLPCAEGCDSCEDGSPCIAALNWPMRMSILVLACTVIGLLPPAAWFTFRYQQVKVVRAASPALLRVIALGAFFIYCTTILMYPNPSLYTCTARIWFREIGFSLTYGALMLKTWRISVIFQVRSAKTVKISDGNLLKRLGIICGVFGIFLLVRTLVSPPDVVVGRTADDLKAFLCKTDWWDYTFTSMEVLFLAWGVRLCIMVRKAPSEFNESRFISMAIYNEFLLTCFLNVSMLFLQSPANPDLLYIIFFCHTQLTVTLLLGLIFGSKVYIVLRSGKVPEAISMGPKSSAAKFNFRTNVRTFANPSTATTSTAQLDTRLSDQEALEEIRQLSIQLQRIQELAPPKGVAVMTITSLLEGLKTTTNQLSIKSPAMPLASMNHDIQKYQQNNNLSQQAPVNRVEKSINTSLIGEEFLRELIQSNTKIKCNSCAQREASSSYLCQQLGSPQPEGSISFSNIQLDCMCSQPDDLDYMHTTTNRSHKNSITNNGQLPPLTGTESGSGSGSGDRSASGGGGSYRLTKGKPRNRSKTAHQKFHSSSSLIQSKSGNNLPPNFTATHSSLTPYCDSHKSSEHFLICDNCKNKINFNDKHENGTIQIRHEKGNEFLDRTSAVTNLAAIKGSFSSAGGSMGDSSCSTTVNTINKSLANKTTMEDHKNVTKSSEDVTFHTTDDDTDENETSNAPPIDAIADVVVIASTSTVIENQNTDNNGSNTNLSTSTGSVVQKNGKTSTQQQRPSNLVLDLNDRSKYTKEVSV